MPHETIWMDYIQKIETYFDCYRNRDLERLRHLLSKDFRHVSPYGEWTDRDAMLNAIWPSVTGEVYATNLEVFGDGPSFLVRYTHNDEAVSHFVEYFQFKRDKITEIEVYLGKGGICKSNL